MITKYLNRFMQRWLLSLSKEMIKEAKWLKEKDRINESVIMISLAHVIIRTDGDLR